MNLRRRLEALEVRAKPASAPGSADARHQLAERLRRLQVAAEADPDGPATAHYALVLARLEARARAGAP